MVCPPLYIGLTGVLVLIFSYFSTKTYDAQHTKRDFMQFADSIGPDQRVLLCSLTSAFSACQHILQYPLIL